MEGARRYSAMCRSGLSRAALHRVKKWGELKEPAHLEVEGGIVKLYLRGHLSHEIPIAEVLPLHDSDRPYRCYALHAPPSRDITGDEDHYAVCLVSTADGEAFLQSLSRSIEPPSPPQSLILLRSLSDELVLHIFSFLTPADLLRAAQVCVQWNILSSDHALWRRAYVRAFASSKLEAGLRWKEQFLRHAHWRRRTPGSSDGDERPTRIIKLVAVGDSVGSEKTALLMAYAHDQFPDDYVPTVFENNVVSLQVGDFNVELHLWDTTGAEQYDRLRPLSYANANVFLLVFSVVEPTSFDNILNKWSPELHRFCPRIPKLLVGTQIERRADAATLARLHAQGRRPVEAAEAEAVLPQLRASCYLECSARTGQNRDQVFLEAVKAVLLQKRDSKCTIL